MSCVTCHISRVTCHLSRVICHLSHNFFYIKKTSQELQNAAPSRSHQLSRCQVVLTKRLGHKLSLVTIWVFECCHNLNFILFFFFTIWVFQFYHNFSFVTFWVFEFLTRGTRYCWASPKHSFETIEWTMFLETETALTYCNWSIKMSRIIWFG